MLGRAQRGIARHECNPTGVRPDVDRRQVRICRHDFHASQRTAEHLGGYLRGHSVGALADFRCTRVNHYSAIAINFDVYGRMRHVGPNDGIGCPADVVTASQSQSPSLAQLAFALLPSGAFNHLLNRFRQAIALHAQAVDGDTGWLEQIAAPNLGRINAQLGANLIELRLEGKAHIDRAVPAHGSACRLVGQHAIAVVLNVGNVVQGAQQRARIKNSDDAIRTVRATVLHHAGFDCGDAAVVLHGGLEINNRARTAAVGPEDLLARVGDLHRSAGSPCRDRSDDFQRDHFALAAKSATDQRLDHPDLRHRHLEHQRELVLQVVRHLRGGPHGQTAQVSGVRIELKRCQRGMRLHGSVGNLVGNEPAFRHVIRFPKGLLGIAENMVVIFFDVVRLALVDQVRLRLHRFFRIEVGG